MGEQFREVRADLIAFMKKQLIGPIGGETEKLKDAPHKRYLMGTLFPLAACIDQTDESQGEDSTTEALSNDFKPSSMAMSFAADTDTVLLLQVSAGQYQKRDQTAEWQRNPLEYHEEIRVKKSVKKEIFGGKARLDISIRPYTRGKIVTIALSNKEGSGELLDPTTCLYQCALSVVVKEGCINEYPSSDRFKLDDEQKDLDLAYRKRVPWAVGHGVAVDWELNQHAVPYTIRTEPMPTYEVKDFSTDIDAAKYPDLNPEILSITRIADPSCATQEELLAGYDLLVTTYSNWIAELEAELLARRYEAARERIIGRLKKTAGRMRRGIELLRSNQVAMKAFRLANKAMLMQMIHTGKNFAGKPKYKNWGYISPNYFSEEAVEKFKWRPFQLAYQLLVLESMVPDPETNQLSPSHDDVDLLWFPTGGGKTEAYLAVAAWEMIYRRMTLGKKGGGTAVIKRYTLRLLTSQQFQRAGSLICALETLRKDNSELGEEPFTLGLWTGQASTPNDFRSAHEKFTIARQDQKPENGFQLQCCPWCGTRIIPTEHNEDCKAYGIRCNRDSKFEFFCPSESCDFHRLLPIQVVDDALYAAPPTLLIGTIDKFARLTWKAEAASFFGNGKTLPPSLIIQDELHLISGPLGTIAGIYEAGFDTIMEVLGAKPKVIAATATIRAAQQQSVRLFGRNVNVFPPSGTDEADSFFSKEEKDKLGRLYVGIMPSGHTGQTSLIQSCAAALQAPFELGFKDDLLDSYWTLPVYHNSRRELGKTMTLARDDIPERIRVITDHPRNIAWVEELSAGIRGSKIPDVLRDLGRAAPDAIDVLPCTNMISVGVDISRLGMMVINGQPKATAEYIQASSRVGRSKERAPGIVITQYSPTKPRDRSHYETFRGYHQALYRHVEPTSVTPWALPALERALHAALVAAVRVTGYLRGNDSAKHFDASSDQFLKIQDILVSRINAAMKGMPQSETESALQYLQSLIDSWEERAQAKGRLTHYESTRGGAQFKPLLQPFESNNHTEAWSTLNSMRNVDTETNLFIRGEL